MTFASNGSIVRISIAAALALGLSACGGDPNTGGETHWANDAMTSSDATSTAGTTSGADMNIPSDTATVADASQPSDSMGVEDTQQDAAPDTGDMQPSDVTAPDGPAIEVMDQPVDDPMVVTMGSVWALAESWVVIEDGAGTVIGHAPVTDFGTDVSEQNLQVSLERALVDGELLTALLVDDLGVVDTFEYPATDTVTIDDAGAEVSRTFTVTYPAHSLGMIGEPAISLAAWLPIEGATAPVPTWLVAYPDDGAGAIDLAAPRTEVPTLFSGLLGASDGAVGAVVWPPLTDGEVVHLVLHEDDGDGLFDPALDTLVLAPDDGLISSMGTVTVPDGTPAASIARTPDLDGGPSTWNALPAGLGIVGPDPGTLTLGLHRYQLANGVMDDPISLVTTGSGMQADTVLLSQDPASTGTFDADADVAWDDQGTISIFTLTPALAAELDGWSAPSGESGAIMVE